MNMAKKETIRVRFAPSPTGMLHLGNVRTALMNYLFAKKQNGDFVLRIEDTDPNRIFDKDGAQIIKDLLWLGLDYNEGPNKDGAYAPYIQSQRAKIYQEKLNELIEKNLVYRCFCTQEELDAKRKRQIALKLPPRYDRQCAQLSAAEIKEKLDAKKPFIWRMKLDPNKKIIINDLAHGTITFNLKHFSDFPLTRQNGTFTFMFANFVDDMIMNMSHVLRGEDHLSNTAGQAALYQAFNVPLPVFWHLPIICNTTGKKLSKRDFGFALDDLRTAGYLPEALVNYLAIIGGGKFDHEIMSLDELAQNMHFDHMASTGHVRYDPEKLNWINHKWIQRIDHERLVDLCLGYLVTEYPEANKLSREQLSDLIKHVKNDLHTLKDINTELQFYFVEPTITFDKIAEHIDDDQISACQRIIKENLDKIEDPQQLVSHIKEDAKKNNVSIKNIFKFMRLALTGLPNGPGIGELIDMLGVETAVKRLVKLI